MKRRQKWGSTALLAMALVTGCGDRMLNEAGFFETGGPTRERSRTAAVERGPSRLPPLSGETLAFWHRHALHALLESRFDDDEAGTLRWEPTHALTACADARLDTEAGTPPEPGSPWPAGPFTLVVRLDDCLPFGPTSLGLTGTLRLRVTAHADRIEAWVVPDSLVVVSEGVGHRAELPFQASLALGKPWR